jgi:aspartate kinase
MQRLVLKFGGTSMGAVERIQRAARIVAAARQEGQGLCVVVSAMAGETDRLVRLAREAGGEIAGGPAVFGPGFDDEYDVIVAAGEQVATGLLALALRQLGLPARSWQNWQIPIRTDGDHARARIQAIESAQLGARMDGGEVAVIPGFQGICPDGRITTLGRGGSDTSAVAMAAALRAQRCDIYTDVDGVYTTDPRIVKNAQRLDRIAYEEMLELASLGAKVLQTRSVELAMAHQVKVRVLSSFLEPGIAQIGTLVCAEDEAKVEQRIVSGVAYSRDEARVALFGVPDNPGVAAEIFGRLAKAGVNVDMIVQSQARREGAQNIVFTVTEREAQRALDAVRAGPGLGFEEAQVRRDVAKVSVIGIGMRSHTGVAHTMFAALASKGINIEAISTSEIKISVLIDAQYVELAVRALHTAYGLDAAA